MQVNKILTGFVFVGVRISMRNSVGGGCVQIFYSIM
jgi:hypothetical protein